MFIKATGEQREQEMKDKFTRAMQRQLNVIFMLEQMLSLGHEMERSENENYGVEGVTTGNTHSVRDKLKLLQRSAVEVLLIGISLYIHLTFFLSHGGENHQFIIFSKHMYIQNCHIALLFRKEKDTTLC